ncbi:MAG: EpsG family protein [Angelakisella sp.]
MAIYFLYLVSVVMVGWYLLGDKVTTKQKSNCMLAFGLFLVAMMTLRYSIGYDFISYSGMFDQYKAMPWDQFRKATGIHEFIFHYLMKGVAAIGGGYYHFLLVCNLIMVGCVLWVIYRHSPVWWLSLTLYLTLQFVPHSMNLLRQSLAASIAFAGWDFLRKGKFWKYTAVILLASCFHISALIMIPCYFLLRLPFTLPVLVVYGVGLLGGYFAFDPLLKLATTLVPQYEHYIASSIYGQGNSFLYVLLPFVLAIAALLLAKPLIARKKSNSILVYSTLFTFVFYLFMTKMYIIERLSIYFFMYAMLLLPEIVAMFRERDEQNAQVTQKLKQQALSRQTLAILAIMLVSVGYLLFAAKDGYHKTYPYVGVWEQEKAISNDQYYQEHS